MDCPYCKAYRGHEAGCPIDGAKKGELINLLYKERMTIQLLEGMVIAVAQGRTLEDEEAAVFIRLLTQEANREHV